MSFNPSFYPMNLNPHLVINDHFLVDGNVIINAWFNNEKYEFTYAEWALLSRFCHTPNGLSHCLDANYIDKFINNLTNPWFNPRHLNLKAFGSFQPNGKDFKEKIKSLSKKKLHRIDGPAVMGLKKENDGKYYSVNKTEEWWLNGKRLSIEKLELWFMRKNIVLTTKEGQLAFEKRWG